MPYAIPPNYFNLIMGSESSGEQYAKNPYSSASGIFQFTRSTWEGLGFNWADRFDNNKQWSAVRALTQQNAGALSRLGLPITNENLYAFHFFGADTGGRVLRADSSRSISSLVSPLVMSQNPFLRGMSVGDFKSWLARKMGGSGASNPSLSGIGSNISLGNSPIDIDPESAARMAAAVATGNPVAMAQAGLEMFGDDMGFSNPLDGILEWLKELFSPETGVRFVFVIVGLILIVGAIISITKTDKLIIDGAKEALNTTAKLA